MKYNELCEALEPYLKEYPLKLREHFLVGLRTGFFASESNFTALSDRMDTFEKDAQNAKYELKELRLYINGVSKIKH